MKALKEVQKLKHSSKSDSVLENFFKENCLPVQMQAPLEKLRELPKSKLLILVNHQSDESQWLVNTFLVSKQCLLMAAYDGITVVTRKKETYIPLPLAEEIIGFKLDNFRAEIARHIQMLKEKLTAQ